VKHPMKLSNNVKSVETHMSKRYVSEVDIFLGTDSTFDLSTGNTYPAIVCPWGMTAWAPQTREGKWFFHRADPKLQGLRATHQPSPWIGDYGQFLLMPFTGAPVTTSDARSSSYVWNPSSTGPGGARLKLLRYGIDVQITPTERCAALQMHYEQDQASLMISLFKGQGQIEIDAVNREVRGWTSSNHGGTPENFALHFVIRFDGAITQTGVIEKGQVVEGKHQLAGDGPQGYVVFDLPANRTVHAQVATSFISRQQALVNLKQEVAGRSFESLRKEADDAWNQELGRIAVEANESQRRKFYSCLYRCLQFPRKFYEISEQGRAMHFSPYDGKVHDGVMYTDIGFWDAHRTLFPLLSFAWPQRLGEMIQGWINAWRQGGWLPRWSSPGYRNSMVGTHAEVVLAEAIVKGIPGFDVHQAYEAIRHSAATPGDAQGLNGRMGLEAYEKLGYVPADRYEYSVSCTLDAALCDSAVAAAAKYLNRHDDAKYFFQRSMNYRNLYDAQTRFLRGRNEDGSWAGPFDESEWGGCYCEGGPWQYLWAVPHDPQGLIDLMGGPVSAIERLEHMLTMTPQFKVGSYPNEIHEMTEMVLADFGNYAHSNQPVHHNLMMFTWAGAPERTRYWVHRVAHEMYTLDRFPGDEDNGEMAAWYVFATLGLYPFCPASAEYVLVCPLHRRVTITPEGSQPIVIEASVQIASGSEQVSVEVNGQHWPHLTIDHSRFKGKTHLRFYRSTHRMPQAHETSHDDASNKQAVYVLK